MSGPARRVARIWRGRTPASRASEYLEFLRRRAFPDYRATEGNRGVQLLFKTDEGISEFVLISHWDDFDAVRRFAGSDPERAVYYPEDDGFLLEKGPRVTHYEVVE